MGLAEIQAALARLAVDASLRDRFFGDPRGVGISLGLSANEAAGLATMSRPGLEQFAGSLRWKRREQVRRLIPVAAHALGRQYAALFERYVDECAPRGSRADLEDATAFVRSIGRSIREIEPQWVVDLARYELAWRQAARAQRLPVVRLFGYPVERLVSGSTASAFERQATLALWWRWPLSGRACHATLRLPSLTNWKRPHQFANSQGE